MAKHLSGRGRNYAKSILCSIMVVNELTDRCFNINILNNNALGIELWNEMLIFTKKYHRIKPKDCFSV